MTEVPAGRTPALPRGRLLKVGALAAAGGGLLGAMRRDGQSVAATRSPRQDAKILTFALQLEHLQAAFYGEALERGALKGELHEYAEAAADHERAHVKAISQALGNAAKAPRFRFGDATRKPRAFGEAARTLEDLTVQAYNGQGPNLTPAALATAAKIVSVEARHAAWIRDIIGEEPAPEAAEPSLGAQEVTRRLNRLGFVR
jgi:ferritin-like protein